MSFYQALLLCLVLVGLPHTAWAKWYLLASVHPNNLVVIDTETDTVVQNIALEGRGPALNIAPNPAHPQYAYVVNNLSQSVAMVDLDEGKQVTSFSLSSDTELVRTMAIDVSAQGDLLFIHEMPLKKEQGSYTALDNRIRVIDLNTQQTLRTFPAPRQVMSLASSKDGKRLYVFSVGQDIFVYDTETGEQHDSLPLLNRNITGVGRTDGLPLGNPYQEHGHLVSFGAFVTDTITGQVTLGVASLDLNKDEPEVEVVELQPFTPEFYVLTGALSPTTRKAYFAYNTLWRVDPQTRRIEKTSPLPNTYFMPFIHPQGTKLYCGSNWHDVAVFDAESLELLTKIELGATQTGGGNVLRFVQR
jgi:WD40 repeat protein